MGSESVLKDKIILVVDDGQDVLDSVSQMPEMCVVHKAKDYGTAHQYLLSYT
jgi:FixJ family two-component response regulator